MIISEVRGRQVLDSRGNPTVEAEVYCGHLFERAIVPSGASTGKFEALELRDNKKEFHGKSVRKAISNIKLISKKVSGIEVTEQGLIDKTMLDLDNTPNKSKLGANSILAVSMACSRMAAHSLNIPLYEYINKIFKYAPKYKLPVPFANIINGGKHAEGDLKFQEFMIAPIKAKKFADAARMCSEITQSLKKIIAAKYGNSATRVGDEGGFAPSLKDPREALELIGSAIKELGYTKEVKIAMDAAASEFFEDNYYLAESGKRLSPGELVDYYNELIKTFPIVSLEDPFDQTDFDSFAELTKKSKIQIVGDDLLVTNVERIKQAIEKKSCNSLLLKVNQIGSLTESFAAAKLAMENNWTVMVSHRSGETEDAFIADLAVGLSTGQIKLGAPVRGERTCKYNQLLRIEEELGKHGFYGKW